MYTARSPLALLFLTVTTLLLPACDSGTTVEGGNQQPPPSNYISYRNSGVTLAHPGAWKVSVDDTPGIYADREIGFDVSNVSTFRLMITNENRTLDSATRLLKRQLRLEDSPSVSDYEHHDITLTGQPGHRLTWTQTMLESSDFELTIVKLPTETGSAFAVFQLVDEDIAKYREDKAETIRTIDIN